MHREEVSQDDISDGRESKLKDETSKILNN